MKGNMITEFVKFKVIQTVTEEQLLSGVDRLNGFQKEQDGFIDAELLKEAEETSWCLIYHYENMEKVKAIGEKLRQSEAFQAFTPMIVPGTMQVTFFPQVRVW